MVFYPNLLQVNAGDSVTFEAVDKGHNSASIKKMIPDGAEPWKGKINKDTTIKFDVPGFMDIFALHMEQTEWLV